MPTHAPAVTNADQIDYWNAKAGETWARFQDQLDRQIAPLGDEAMRLLAPKVGEHIVDIGCGCGQTSLDLAQRVGPGGRVTGVDISKPMLEVARGRPRPAPGSEVVFRKADAQTVDLGRAAFDAAFSRFGVMFFNDPSAAFANVCSALRPGGRLVFVCWRSLAENIWMRVPLEAAMPMLPPLPSADPLAPGPFAFAEINRVRGILAAAGFRSIRVEPFDAMIGGGGLEETVSLTFRVGPLARALADNRDRVGVVAESVRSALMPYQTAEGVMMPAAVWIVEARAG